MPEPVGPLSFEREMLPHLDAAYNFARWLTRNEHDAQDVVQEVYLRAFRFFDQLRGENARPWLLRIVRNTCFTWLRRNRSFHPTTEFDEALYGPDPLSLNPEEVLLRNERGTVLRHAMKTLPRRLREVLVLRELEGLSYKEIAEATGTPAGTVMSRLSRARAELRESLTNRADAYGLPASPNASRIVPPAPHGIKTETVLSSK